MKFCEDQSVRTPGAFCGTASPPDRRANITSYQIKALSAADTQSFTESFLILSLLLLFHWKVEDLGLFSGFCSKFS